MDQYLNKGPPLSCGSPILGYSSWRSHGPLLIAIRVCDLPAAVPCFAVQGRIWGNALPEMPTTSFVVYGTREHVISF